MKYQNIYDTGIYNKFHSCDKILNQNVRHSKTKSINEPGTLITDYISTKWSTDDNIVCGSLNIENDHDINDP